MNAFETSFLLAFLLTLFFIIFTLRIIWEDHKRAKLEEKELKKAKPN